MLYSINLFGIGYILSLHRLKLIAFYPCVLVLAEIELIFFIHTMVWICDENGVDNTPMF